MNTTLGPALRRTKDRGAVDHLRRLGLAERAVVHHLAAGHVYDFDGDTAVVVRGAPMGVSTTTVLRPPASVAGWAGWSGLVAALAKALPADRLVVRLAPGSAPPAGVALRLFQHWVEKIPSRPARRRSGTPSVRPARDGADLEFAADLSWRSFIDGTTADHPDLGFRDAETGQGRRDAALSEVLIADVAGRRAGHLTWEIKVDELSRRPHAVVLDLAVLPEYAGHEVGTALADALESRQATQRSPLSLVGGIGGPEADRVLGRLRNDGWAHRFSTWGIGRWATG